MFEEIRKFIRSMNHPVRGKVVDALQKKSPLTVTDLRDITGCTSSEMSQQLKIMREAGTVDTDKQGKWVYYSLSDKCLETVAKLEDIEKGLEDGSK